MDNIIVMFENEDKKLNMSLYDYVYELYQKAIPFLVCSVTPSEYSIIEKQAKKGLLSERSMSRFTSSNKTYNKFRYVMTYDSKKENIVIFDYNNLDTLGNYVVDSSGFHFDETGISQRNHPSRKSTHTIKIYTSESYEQIIDHYKKKFDIDFQIQQKMCELAELIGINCNTCNTICCGDPEGIACSRWSHEIRLK